MAEVMYSQPLRAIGQDLESLHVQSFEMEPVGDLIMVRGAAPAASKRQLSARLSAGKASWDKALDSGNSQQTPREESGQIKIFYSAEDVDLLEREGRLRRGASGKAADASSLSQTLRCVGGYLHQKCARLLKVMREPESVTLEYETSLGNRMRETFAVRDLYDLWVRMYLQRQARTSDR